MIDILFCILILLACYKGYTKGLIVALFSFAGYFIGLAAAIKLSAFAAAYLRESANISTKLLPAISFALVFICVVILVHLGAKLIQKAFEMVMLGWANKLAGIVLYMILYTIILSTFLFYTEKLHFLQPKTIQSSQTYNYIQPWGPYAIDGFGKIAPVFKDMFTSLEVFFESVPEEIPVGQSSH